MLGRDVAAALPEMRSQAESMMTDTVEVRHPGGVLGPFDDTLGYAPLTPHAPHYTGPAKIKPRPVQAGDADVAGQTVTSAGDLVSLPVAVVTCRPEDIVTCTASATDQANVGRVLRVDHIETGTYVSARRLSCVDYQEDGT